MTPEQPDVLVVLPTLGDRLDTLRETLQSVQHQRDDLPLTLAVVAPADALDARELAASYGARLVDDPRIGISAAINRGLSVRTTERFYAWVGDDDLFRAGGLAQLRSMLESDARAVVAYGACDYIDPEGRTIFVSAAGPMATFLLPWGPDLIPNPSALIRFDALEAIGGFDEELKYAMDLDAFLSLRRYGRFRSTKRAVSAFRWHPESLTVANRLSSSREAERVKTRHLPRPLRPIAPLWHLPVRWASSLAASRVNARARALDTAQSGGTEQGPLSGVR